MLSARYIEELASFEILNEPLQFDGMFVRASWYTRREENQLDAAECFIALIICSTCFGHLYAHHQELETILVLLPHMVCNALVAGGRRFDAGQQAMCPG